MAGYSVLFWPSGRERREGQPWEVKHLSTRWKRNRNGISLVAASEKETAQTLRVLKPAGVAREGLRGFIGRGGRLFGKSKTLFIVESAGKQSHRR